MSRELMVLCALMAIHAVWVAAPLLPAILIYRLFPSSTVAVSGPLAGLTVRATGAFGGYLIVFASTYSLATRTQETIGSFQKPYWTVNAHLELLDKDNKPIDSRSLQGAVNVSTNPNPFTIENDQIRLVIPEGEVLPFVIFQIPRFGGRVINLGNVTEKFSIDRYRKTIDIEAPIKIVQQVSTSFGSPISDAPK